VPATTPEREVLATMRLYFHPATVETKYSGSAQVGFFGGSPAAHELKLDATVKPDDSPATNTIYAIVTSQPGTHRVRIAAVASPVPTGRAANIREQINVTVRWRSSQCRHKRGRPRRRVGPRYREHVVVPQDGTAFFSRYKDCGVAAFTDRIRAGQTSRRCGSRSGQTPASSAD
jgi:hypothetical protein